MDTELRKILLVEDDSKDVELTMFALKEGNFAARVVVVCDGEEALDYLYRRGEFEMRSGGDPILVLLDLKMPKVTGFEVLKIIKADAYLRIVPIVVLSSSGEVPDLVSCYQNGANAYVVKPVDFSEFKTTLKHLVAFWAGINKPPPPARREEPVFKIAV